MVCATQSHSSPPSSAFRWLLETICWYYIIVMLGNCIAYGSVNSLKTIINDSDYSYLHGDCGVFSGSALWTWKSLLMLPLTDSKHHFSFSCDAKVHKGRTVKNGSVKGWCHFVYTKLISTPKGALPPSSYLAAGWLGPQVWGCGQTEQSLPSCLELAPAIQQLWWGKSLAGFCGAGLQKRLWKTVEGNLPNLLFVP